MVHEQLLRRFDMLSHDTMLVYLHVKCVYVPKNGLKSATQRFYIN